MLETLNVEEFLQLKGTLYDVRSPLEFTQGTIPGALSLPLFSDQERAQVGTLYKKDPSQAYLHGLELVGPKLHCLAAEGLKNRQDPFRGVFCFRGGQRSTSVAWLFRSSGLPTITLKGGYKAFRRFVLKSFTRDYLLQVIGGMSGSGKTDLLHQYRREGKQVIDLEALAGHKGSVFGYLGKPKQPSVEQFENALACSLMAMDLDQPIWIEDESRLIGLCKIPDPFYQRMKQAPFHFLPSSKKERLERLTQEYSHFPEEELIVAVYALRKRLGEVRIKEIITHIREKCFFEAAGALLDYYDKAYLHSIEKRKIDGS